MAFTERAATGPRRSFELPEVLPLQSATTTSTDRGAQADQEEFRAASPKDAMPEPDPTAAAGTNDPRCDNPPIVTLR
ncbi:hypothetical protein PISMIDRAFT_476610 [Pisolithus microcarpus 441]|uniref:Uncharacterized protein n=1 Tax=Pisolithus microcarpus 441 TaxID=765257 RepID=A0A0C9YCW4_9AGAM|nr:hypothetical protein BKA83DRAFT_476610 [Pisolithus microcarpus]KIK11689.1 hypothetical protein PISMIDRAFT_476610 [Pisolithus microcarpus 441]